jgi:hypothetical protein
LKEAGIGRKEAKGLGISVEQLRFMHTPCPSNGINLLLRLIIGFGEMDTVRSSSVREVHAIVGALLFWRGAQPSKGPS